MHLPASRLPRRRELVAALALAASSAPPPLPALAYCNGVFPGKISNDVQEQIVPFTLNSYRTDVFVRAVRPPKRRVSGGFVAFETLPDLPAVLVVGCPGVPYDYVENLEALVLSGRRVFMANTCEAPVERSWLPQRPPRGTREQRRPEVAGRQLLAVCDACGLEAVHVVAHGLGGAAALHFADLLRQRQQEQQEQDVSNVTAAAQPPPPPRGVRLASLALVSPYGSLEDLRPVQQRRLSNWDELFPIDTDEEGNEGTEDGQQCVVDATLLTGRPWREALLYATRDEERKERLGGSRLAARLPPAPLPTLLLRGGAADPIEPDWDLRSRPDVKQIEYRLSGHLPFIDNREEVLLDMLDFMDAVDGVSTNRMGLVDGTGKMG